MIEIGWGRPHSLEGLFPLLINPNSGASQRLIDGTFLSRTKGDIIHRGTTRLIDGTLMGLGDIPGISREPYGSNYEYKKRSGGF
jgi:hypothetical protein